LAKPGCRIVQEGGCVYLEKRASTGMALSLLRNEAQALVVLAGLNISERISFSQEGEDYVLRRAYVTGPRLDELPLRLWPSLLSQLKSVLLLVHDRGLIHGDLKPSNLIVNNMGLTPIDWEHALPIGELIENMPFRAMSLGTSDPRLIWGKGYVLADLDLYSIAVMSNRAEKAHNPHKGLRHSELG
jgi:serine/threonine protein kinase